MISGKNDSLEQPNVSNLYCSKNIFVVNFLQIQIKERRNIHMRNTFAKNFFFLLMVSIVLISLTACTSTTSEDLKETLLNSDFAEDIIFCNSTETYLATSFSDYDFLKAWVHGGDSWAGICKTFDDLSRELFELTHKKVDVTFLIVNPAKTYDILYATTNGDDITNDYSKYWREAAKLPHDVGEVVSYAAVIGGAHSNETVALKAKIDSITLDFSDWCHYDLRYCDESGNYSIQVKDESFLCTPENEAVFKRMISFDAGDEVILYYNIYADNSFGPTSLLWVDYIA